MPAASLEALPSGREEGEPSPGNRGEGHGSSEDPGGAAAKKSPAYGALNVQKVTTGTGEALPGPVVCERPAGAPSPITVSAGSGHRTGWASEAVVVLIEPSGQHNRR